MKRAVIICSGGLDSVTLLHKAAKELGKENVHVLNFHYGSKHNDRERPFARENAKILEVPYTEINLDYINNLWKSDLLQSGGKIPEGHYSDDSMRATVVPFRNAIMLSNAVGYCESIDFDEVWLGSHQGDRAQYPDCTKEFTAAINLAAILGTHKKIQIKSPFNEWMKWDIVKWGLENGVDYSKTRSCYNSDEKSCLLCSTCTERAESFYRNSVKDPLLTDDEWSIAVVNMKKAIEDFNREQAK